MRSARNVSWSTKHYLAGAGSRSPHRLTHGHRDSPSLFSITTFLGAVTRKRINRASRALEVTHSLHQIYVKFLTHIRCKELFYSKINFCFILSNHQPEYTLEKQGKFKGTYQPSRLLSTPASAPRALLLAVGARVSDDNRDGQKQRDQTKVQITCDHDFLL